MAYSEDVNVNLNVLTGTMSGITAIMGGMSALTSSFGAMGTTAAESFGTLDGLLVSATALLSTFTMQSAEAFGQYEQGMKIVQTVSGQTAYSMNELSNQANQMAISYRTSINDIADGLQTLGRAGLNSVNEQLEVLESGLQTAKLEGRNLNGVLEEIIQNTAMLGGDLKSVNFGEQTEYLNSLMVGTSMTAPITSHDISQTLQYAGGTAAAAGANLENKDKLEDLMGTIAAFAQKGVKGSMSGTALRAFFTKPASQDTSVVDALSSIGLSPEDLWEDGGESMKKVSDQVGIIKRRMDALNLSTMEQVELWGKIVGPKMGQQMMKLDSSSVKELTRDIQSAQSAEDLATKTLHTYSQKMSEISEKGNLAYRDFGQKVVAILNPVLDIVSILADWLANPYINLAAFITVGSVLAHGFTTAWNMISTIFAQIKGLISETGVAIQNINALAGGSAPGFNQSAASIEILNSRLAQTNMELAQMQAQFMKIQAVSKTGAYVVPLGLADKNGKLPANMISTDMQKIIRGPNNRYFDQSNIRGAENAYRQQMIDQNTKNQAIHDKYSGKNALGNMTYYDPAKKMKVSAEEFNKAYPIMSKSDIDKYASESVKNNRGQIHSSLMSMTEKEYRKWYNDLKYSDAQINKGANYREGGRYIKSNGAFDHKLYEKDSLKSFNKYYQDELVRNSGGLHTNTVNGMKFYRGLHLAEERQRFYGTDRILQKQPQLQQYEEARAAKLSPKATGFSDKALQVTQNRLNAYNNALSKVTGSVTNFGSNLKLSANKWIKGFDSVMPQFQTKAMNALKGIEIGKTSFNEGLIQLQKATGLSAVEFQKLWANSTELEQAFLRLYGVTTADAEVTEADVIAKKADASATIADMAAKEKEALASAGGIVGRFSNGLKTATGYLGGPFMAGMMAFTAVSMLWQQSVQSWQKTMSDATNQLSEAKDKMTTTEDNIKELFSSENNTISEADLDKIIDYQYGSIQESYNADMSKHGPKTKPKFSDMYNNEVIKVKNLTWTDEEKDNNTLKTAEDLEALNESTETLTLTEEENIKKLEENTVALNQASYAFSQALNKESKVFNDFLHGYKGIVSGMEDRTGFEGLMAILTSGGLYELTRNPIINALGKQGSFFEYDSPVLTQYQSGDNYAGSTDFAPILSADIQKLGVEGGLKQFFGSDFNSLVQSVDQINHKSGSTLEYLSALSNSGFQGMSDNEMAMAQMLWKEDPETVQKLAKQMYWSETEHGGSAMESWQTGKLRERNLNEKHPSSSDYYRNIDKKKYTVNDKNLQNTMNKIYRMTDGKLSYANMLAMGQMQMLADMYSVANEQIYPALSQTMIAANQNVLATGAAGTNAGNASQNAGAAANNAAVIAGMLGEKLKQEVGGLEYENDYLADPNGIKSFWGIQNPWIGDTLTKEQFLQGYNNLDNSYFDTYRLHGAQTEMGFTARTQHPDWSPDEIQGYIDRSTAQMFNPDGSIKSGVYRDWGVMQNTILSPALNTIADTVRSAYEQSNVGEYGGGSGTGGGGSGGSGGSGSDKDKDSGSKKERVDLVLCNKKEIPKLNVNLFKKPPNFTILNKNFKLRDIKINSQDKPKAIMNAIKNGIIETQKRMDPKIIQDEDAVYDPLGSTDGSSTPSGTTKTTT